MTRPAIAVTALQEAAIANIRFNAPIYPRQLAVALGIPNGAGEQLVRELVTLGFVERFEPKTYISDVYVVSRKGMDAALQLSGHCDPPPTS